MHGPGRKDARADGARARGGEEAEAEAEAEVEETPPPAPRGNKKAQETCTDPVDLTLSRRFPPGANQSREF